MRQGEEGEEKGEQSKEKQQESKGKEKLRNYKVGGLEIIGTRN